MTRIRAGVPPAGSQRDFQRRLVLFGLVATVAAAAFPQAKGEGSVCPGTTVAVRLQADRDEHRCDLVRQFLNRGVDTSGDTWQRILAELGRAHASKIELAGTVALARPTLDYLFDELPDAARLINHYENTRYEVEYLDDRGKRFFGTNNRNMHAVFTRFDSILSPGTSRHLLFESGEATFLIWRFEGSAVIELELLGHGGMTDYAATLHLFTDSMGYHSLFKSGLFGYFVRSIVRRIIAELVSAARRAAESSQEIETVDAGFVGRLRMPPD